MKKLIIGISCLLLIAAAGKVFSKDVYQIIEFGTSDYSWEEAAIDALDTAGKRIKDPRQAEVITLDMRIENGKVVAYGAEIKLSDKDNGK